MLGVESCKASLGFAGDARATHESAAGVAGPDAVGGPAVEADVFIQGVGELECFAGAFLRVGVVDDQIDAFVT